jgi:putative ABC transport system permease protein
MMIDRFKQSWQRLACVFRRTQLDRELDVELAAHLEMAIDENLQRGMSAEQARRQALISLGGKEQARQRHREARGLPGLDRLLQDLGYAARGIVKSPGFTAAAVLTLALGIAVNATMFSMVSGYLLRRPSGREPERVVVISSVNPDGTFLPDINAVSGPNYLVWREANDVFESMAAADEFRNANLSWQGQNEALHSAAVSPNYFNMLGVSPQLGRTFSEGDDQPGRDHVVILSHELWDRKFGSDLSTVGRTIRLNRDDYVVIGVMPADFHLMGFTPQLWTPLVLNPADQTAAARKDRSLFLFARLRNDATLEQVRVHVNTLARRAQEDFPETEKGWGAAARTLPDYLVYAFNIRNALIIAMTVVGFVLLIACANVAGLLLARAGARRKELAIRMSLGASRVRIVRQLLTEGMLLALLGAGLGLLLSFWGIKFLRANMAFNEAVSAVPLRLDWNVLLIALVLSVFSALVCSLAPSLTASRTDINFFLKDESRAASAGASKSRLRRVLVTAEIAMALFLLIGTGLLLRAELFSILHQNLGFQTDHLLTAGMTLDDARYKDASQKVDFVRSLLARLRQIPGAEAVALTSDLPATGAGRVTFLIQGQDELLRDRRPSTLDVVASVDYFRTAGIPMLRGRSFTETDDAAAPRVVVVNQEFARRYFKNKDPLGQRIRLDVSGVTPEWREIVGVVGNVKTYPAETRDDPEAYEPFLQHAIPSFSLMVRTGSAPANLEVALRKTVAQVDVELPLVHLLSMSSVIALERGGDLVFLELLGTFALLALILAAIGIYGLTSYSVGQRTHEIAIRMALGAERGSVCRMVLWEGLKMSGIGAAIGIATALPLPKLFAAMLDGLRIGDSRVYIIGSVALVLVAMLAAYIPARRASSIDPIRALHSN